MDDESVIPRDEDDVEEEYTGAIVALIPAESDPITAASSEPAHVTLVYMGDDASALDADALLQQVGEYATRLTPITVPVAGRDTLGDDDAQVVTLALSDALVAVRSGLVDEEGPVKEAYDAVEQYPSWIPHVTLGYPETPPNDPEFIAESVTFDRLGLWMAGERTDFPIQGAAPEDSERAPEEPSEIMAAAVVPEDPEVRAEKVGMEGDDEMPYDELEDDEEEITEIPVHGVLAPEGVPTGDKRMFREGSLTARNLPVPLRYEILGSHGGDTSHVVVVGRVDEVWREGNMVRYKGAITLSSRYAHEVLNGMVDRTVRGVSIDGDDATVEMSAEPGQEDMTIFSSIRVAGLTIVPIPAYQEAYIAFGHEFQEDLTDEEKADQEAILADCGCADAEADVEAYRDVPADERKKLADEDKAMPDGSYPIANEQDLRNAIQSIGRSKDPEKVKAHIKRRARALGKEDLIPEGWSADDVREFQALLASGLSEAEAQGTVWPESFAPGTHDGPGWITHPVPTARIRRYWTKGKGAAKIVWGTPGDWYRCRSQLRKYVQNPEWLAGLCANMHKEATGVWPGDRRNPGNALTASATAPAVRFIDDTYPEFEETGMAIVASAGVDKTYPAIWFEDPKFTKLTPLTVDRETGRVYGHLAAWGVCHVGIPGVCTTPPKSPTNYSAFKSGVIDTDQGPIRVGKLTAGVGHPNPRLRARAATAHYDKPEAVRAFVNVGEDSHGIWFSGVLAPWVSEDQAAQFRMVGSLSGDWRYVNGNLELIGAVSVASPGFPIPQFAIERGKQMSLVAGGAFSDEPTEESAEEIISRIAERTITAFVAQQKRAERLAAAKAALRPFRLAAVRGKFMED